MDTSVVSSASDSGYSSSLAICEDGKEVVGQISTSERFSEAESGNGHLALMEGTGEKNTIEDLSVAEGAKDTVISSLETFKDVFQQFKAFSEANLLAKFEEKMKTFVTRLDELTGQMRDMQLMFLKNSLASQNSYSSPGCIKTEQENLIKFKPQEQVFLTPRKLSDQEQSLRLDVSPVSMQSDTDLQNGVSSTVNPNSRRSLAFPKLSDEHKGNYSPDSAVISSKGRMSIPDGPTPTLSLVNIKTEPKDSPARGDTKLGLLVLADAALTRSECTDQTPFFKTGEAYADHDSGRYSGSSCGGSPTSQDISKGKSPDSFPQYKVFKHNGNFVVPSKFSSSSSTSSDVKLRKRRKVKQPIPCAYCGKCFNNQSSLRQHESFHRPIRPFKCENDKCDKAYKTRSELNRHLVVHSGEKQHECKLCGKRFLRKQYLKTHLLRHHETGLAMVAPSAMESFKDDVVGSIPSIVVSSSLVSQTEPLTWRCQMCFKIFVNNEDLTRHIRSYHEKKKPLALGKSESNIQDSVLNKMEVCSN